MSLRQHLLLVLGVLVGLYAGVQLVIQRQVVAPGFQELEDRLAREDMQRIRDALQSEIAHLDNLCHEWAAWDDTFAYLGNPNPEYVRANLQEATLAKNRLSVVYAERTDGRTAIRCLHELPEDLAAFPATPRSDARRWHATSAGGGRRTGVLTTDAGAMLVAARPILRSDGTGPSAGTLVLGRLLDARRIAELREQTKVEFDCLALGEAAGLGASALPATAIAAGDEGVAIARRGPAVNEVDSILRDIDGAPALLLRARVPRDVSLQGGSAVDSANLATIGAGIAVLLAALLLLQRTVVKPIGALARHTVEIRRSGEATRRLRSTRRDEIGLLARAIDELAEQLARTRAERASGARVDGMAEAAIGVVDDVDHALDVDSAAGEVGRRTSGLPVGDLQRVASSFEAHNADVDAT